MKASKLKLNLVRTNTTTGAVLNREGISFKDALQQVAWCAHDNLNMSRSAASAAADELVQGEILVLGNYTFLATAQATT